ncbi:hypothetical protein SprV_0100374700 [Sparganum proliferum]
MIARPRPPHVTDSPAQGFSCPLKGTPTYGLAKWLFQRLKFLTSDSNTTVSSSTQFLEKLKGVSLLPSDIMVSFDVTSLFTSIPQDLAVETIELLLREKYDETENRLGHAQIIQLLKFCLKTFFTFDGTIYEQVKGTPMGSPISGLIAEAVLQRLESLVFRHHRPKFWARYVDDTFIIIERDQVLTFKEQLNAIFPDIQFTMEEEENNQLTFLDVLVCRKDCGGLKTKVFRKATNTTQILNFNSNHPISHKRSCVRALYRRVETHCSEMEDKVAEVQYLRRVMRANGYPRNFVNQCIRKGHQRPNPTGPKFWRALPSSASPSYLEKDLATCSHVYLRCDRVRRPLEPPNDGPIQVLSRGPKIFSKQRDNREEVVSVDRLKAAVPDTSPDEPCVPLPSASTHAASIPPSRIFPLPSCPLPPTATTNSNTSATRCIHSSTDPVYITHSGRHAHFPDRLVTHFF